MRREGSLAKILVAWVGALALVLVLLLWVSAQERLATSPVEQSIYTETPEAELPAVPDSPPGPVEAIPVITF